MAAEPNNRAAVETGTGTAGGGSVARPNRAGTDRSRIERRRGRIRQLRGAGTAVIRGQLVQGCEALHPRYIEETKPATGHETATSDTERRIP